MAAPPPEVLKPLKTWAYLAGRRRRPSEYEIVSTNLHYRQDNPASPWELDPQIPMNVWYRRYCNDSPLKHADWDAFRDPDELVYRTYNIVQDGQETYVNGLLDQFSERDHDRALPAEWVAVLARLYAPARFAFHTLQMGSAYLSQMAPASTISNCATFQAADALRWLTHTAYRTRELDKTHPDFGFSRNERSLWERDPAWQGFRELTERMLVAWDWAEAFTALDLVAKPAVDEAILGALGTAARRNGDTLYGLLSQAQLRDAERHRRWSAALIAMVRDDADNRAVLNGWLAKWSPLGDAAIDAYCSPLPDGAELGALAKERVAEFHASLGLAS